MSYEHDLFISYAHIDNQPLTADQVGWVTRFHGTLAAQLSMRLGSVARIWRDDKLRGNDVFADEIAQKFASTALLVSVLSPRYLASDWCRRELVGFCTEAAREGGLALGNKARVFKVVKTPVTTQSALPPQVRDAKGYDFFSDVDGAPLELDPAYGAKYAEAYFRQVSILAWELAQLLKKMLAEALPQDAANDPAAAPAVPAAPSAVAAADDGAPQVYLAECTADLREVRAALDAELKLHGVRVWPERPVPRDDDTAYTAAATEALAHCALSVHLVGTVYGAVPDGQGDKSVSVLQNDLAAARCHAGGLTRLIWLPEGTASAQPQQQAFIRRLLEDDEAQFGADVLTGDLEALKAALHATLKKLSAAAEAAEAAKAAKAEQAARAAIAANTANNTSPAPTRAAPALVYLVCDQRDRKASVPLRRWLKDQGVEVALPAFEGGAAEVREANDRTLAGCDMVLLFYGAGDEAWQRTTDNELTKRRAMRAADPPLSLTWLDAPTSADKDDLADMADPGGADLIDARAGFDPALAAPLLRALIARATAGRTAQVSKAVQ